ncbi:MAG: peptidase S41, partial [Candidatus Eisenbacteria bacterium]|nr:peptidase S41 [Candidatus Eisenbacteria bacterium]
QGALAPGGERLAYVRGSVPWWRRGYEGNGRYRIWLYDRQTQAHQALAGVSDDPEETGVSSYPAWLPGGDHILYLSEVDGAANLRLLSVSSGERAWLTRLPGDGRLRYPSLARNGSLAAFEYEDGIYVVRLPEAPATGSVDWPEQPPLPERLEIRLSLDPETVPVERHRVTSGADEIALSPDGEQIAFVYRGDIFAMKTDEDEPWARRLTDSPAREHQIAWSPDSKSLIYVSDAGGQRDVYRMRSTDPDDPRLARSLFRETERLTSHPQEEWTPRFAPDGDRIAFVRGKATLMTMRSDGTDPQVVVDGWSPIDYRWSPDSRWFVYSRNDNDYNEDVWIVSADGASGPHNISRHPDDDGNPVWSPDGRMVAFSSRRDYTNQADIWYVWLRREDDEKAKRDILDEEDLEETQRIGEEEDDEKNEDNETEKIEVRIDFEEIHRRLRRVTSFPAEESQVLISADGRTFVFTSSSGGERDLWKVQWDGSEEQRLTTGDTEPRDLQWGKKGGEIFYLSGSGKIASVTLEGGTTGYPYDGSLMLDRRAERAQIFDECWRLMRDNFYDEDFHGADWQAARETYRPWALAAGSGADFADVIRLMLGELNSSHQQYYPAGDDRDGARTGHLGVVFDPDFAGPGLRIARVVPRTPADRVTSRLAAGDVILAVDGESAGPGVNIHRLLDGTVGEDVVLRVRRASGGEETVIIRPQSYRDYRRDLYEEQDEARRRAVTEGTGGRVAYIHIQGMGRGNLEAFERDLYAVAHGREALIIDVRDNSGGWITDMLLAILTAPSHAVTRGRGGEPGYPQGRRPLYSWSKPVVVLCNEFSYSNAEIFSWAIKTIGRGPLIGRRTFGGVISTGSHGLVDGSRMRMPGRGWTSKYDGSNMERIGCPPDIVVENRPADLLQDRDPQLETAIREALRLVGDREAD